MKQQPKPLFQSPEAQREMERIYNERVEAWPVPLELRTIETSLGTGQVLKWGDREKPPLVLLHPAQVNSTSWHHQAEALGKHFQVHAIDYLGDVGMSRLYDHEEFPKNGQEAAHWIEEVIQALGLERFLLAGASMGGWLAMEYASRFPKKVRKLALLAPIGLNPFPRETNERFGQLFEDFTPENLNQFLKWCIGPDSLSQEICLPFLNLGFTHGTKTAQVEIINDGQLKAMDFPVMMVLGETDVFVGPPTEAEARVSDLSGWEVYIMESNHMVSMEQSIPVNQLLLAFLK